MKRLFSMLTSNLFQNYKPSKRRKADDAGASASSLTSTGSNNYDVFLSFGGEDTRKTFVDHLYKGLDGAGIYAFRDDNELREGENIGPSLLQAIKNSKISIPVLSQNYARSKWCLQELVQMIESMKSDGQVVLPVFYGVEPADVRYQKRSFGETFSHFSRKYSEEDVGKWKQALEDVGSLKGWESERTADGREGELVEMIVGRVLSKLKEAFQLVVTEQLVGIDNAVADILRLLDDNPNASEIVGIHGMGGIGKTTLAKVVYNKISDQFQHRSFIADIRESSQRKGISCLQNQLISDILREKDEVPNEDAGIRMMESRFKHKRVLVLLDDVDNHHQLKALIGKPDWFERGSKIIITTRIKSVLDVTEVNSQYELNGIAEDQSLILFCRHAFRRDSPPCEFESPSHDVVSTTGGLPLSLEIIGSYTCGKNPSFWGDALKRLKRVPPEEVQEKLRISYDALTHEEQQIFLDIACFFIGTDLRIASYMWDARDFYPSMGIERLRFMSLIKIGDNHKLKMHDQLRDLGREIVRKEDYNAPMNRSRLWVHEEALQVLRRNKGIEKHHVRALCLNEWRPGGEFTTEQFKALPNLRFLQIHDPKLIGDSKSLPPELRWLKWSICPVSMDASFRLEKLVILDLSFSDVSELWEGWSHLKVAKDLRVLNLTGCYYLKGTPDLSAWQSLEILVLAECYYLEQIHPSIGEVKGLVSLDFSECAKLRVLPAEMGKLQELKELNICWTAIKEIPPCIGSLEKLEILHARGCKSLVGLPDSISHLVNLSTLDLSNCVSLDGVQRLSSDSRYNPSHRVTSVNRRSNRIPRKLKLSPPNVFPHMGMPELPESLGDLRNSKNLPSTIGKLGNLEELHASHCESPGGEFPIDGLSSLKILVLNRTSFSGFPDTFDKLSRLEKLDLRGCRMLQSLPESISKLPSLQHLLLTDCRQLQSLPELPSCLTVLVVTCQSRTLPQLSHLIHLKELTIQLCKFLESIPELPSGILKLSVSNCAKLKELPSLSSSKFLSRLDIQWCKELTEIKGLEALKSLVRLSVIGSKGLSKLDGLEHAESLRYLDISYCDYFIRPDLSQCTHLKRLKARGCCYLVEIKGLERLKNLEFLDISWCISIETLPDLSGLDNLRHLQIDACEKLGDVQVLENVHVIKTTR
ncbi:disease resistance protein L6-like [Rhodamnia argentea]|uniref:Disease resistance protein L6-like n=1 Tax=Rhodamnia argentea TaxID=178133 RepID=A0ABM3HBQ2_9MYRT|nr:disease resistance protein L6-like [Rhodamnia argentea]